MKKITVLAHYEDYIITVCEEANIGLAMGEKYILNGNDVIDIELHIETDSALFGFGLMVGYKEAMTQVENIIPQP